ncbi:protein-disulfide reductase DsbD [Vibrio agarilyticus]
MRIWFATALALLLHFAAPSYAFFDDNAPLLSSGSNQFVPVDQAFPFNSVQRGARVLVDWQIRDDYYLYQERLSFRGENVTIDNIAMEDGTPYHDEFFGDVHIYTTTLMATLQLQDWQPGAKLIVEYQGCAAAGFCYPPEIRTVDITAFDNVTATQTPSASADTTTQSQPTSTTPQPEDSLAATLGQNWWTPLLFFALGIGLAFTPCVLPMYPILTSLVLGQGKLSPRRALALSLVYVQGMALTYTLLGLVVASAGMQFQAAMQHPYVLIGLSVLFVLLALSMFGVYTLQLPSSAQTWLNKLSNQQQGGRWVGVFIMGAISGLVCSPCTTAPLSGALLYVAQTGDLLTGGITLYALALGMGIPLILVAVFGNRLLPKAGNWMTHVKTLFGFVLLAAPLFLLERIVPTFWAQLLWSLLGIAAFGWLYHLKNALPFGGWKQSVVGIIAVLGLVASAQPLVTQWLNPQSSAEHATSVSFIQIETLADLNRELASAKAQGKPVMLDFYADWCVACKEFEKYTFHTPAVANKLQHFVLLQADVTANRVQDIELLKAMRVLGLPTIEFWNAEGEALPQARLTGFMAADPFLAHLNQMMATSSAQ